MTAIERDNPALKDVLPKDYARPALDKTRLGQVVDLVSNIKLGGADARATDVLGSVYEYFLEQFALAEGRKGGEFYTPRSVVRLLVEMLRPYNGRVYDPCCGSSGMFVQSVEFIRAHASGNANGGKARGDISIYGQESNYTTWRMARMNLAIRGIVGQIEHGDSFHNDRHPDLRADYILANPPFNVSDWGGERLRDDKRWEYGVPPAGNANFAWVQHFLYHLAPRGIAGFVLANGSMSSSQSGEGEIRKNLIEADLVDCIVALPGQLFRSTQIPACLWFLSRGRRNGDRDRAARYCSSTPASSDTWRTEPTATCPRRTSPASRTPTTPGAATTVIPAKSPALVKTGAGIQGGRGRRARTTRTFPASARARRWRKSVNTATSSHRAATSVRSRSPTTASPSPTRWPASPPNGASSRPRPQSWTRPSRRTWRAWGLVQGKIAVPTAREAIQLIEQDGWRLIRTRGSHRQFKHPVKPGRVTVPGKPGDDLRQAPGTAY